MLYEIQAYSHVHSSPKKVLSPVLSLIDPLSVIFSACDYGLANNLDHGAYVHRKNCNIGLFDKVKYSVWKPVELTSAGVC
jgi:hypothetical protein